MVDRRRVLGGLAGGLGTLGAAGLAGCLRLAGEGTESPTRTASPTPEGVDDTQTEPPTDTDDSPTPGSRPETPADWRQFQVDAANSGVHPDAVGPTRNLIEEWTVPTPHGEYVTPVVADGTLYTARIAGGYLRGVDVTSGDLVWETVVEDGVGGPPAVADGTVYYPFADGGVRALDADDGGVTWTTDLEHPIRRSAPTVVGGTLYVGASGAVYAIDTESGSIQWRTRTDGDTIGTPAVDFGRVFIGRASGSLQALRATDGSVDWTYDAGAAVPQSPALRNGTLYVGSRDGVVHAVDGADGSAVWTTANGPTERFTDGDGNPSPVGGSPAVSADTVYVTHYRTGVAAFDAISGERRWFTETGSRVRVEPVVADGVVYLYERDGTLSLVDAGTGEFHSATYATMGSYPYPPAVTGGYLFVPVSGIVAVADGP